MTKEYEGIMHLPRPVSAKHPQMPIADRAAQFSPFAALTGHGAAIKETARLTQERVELDESMKDVLSNQLQMLAEQLMEQPEITITYFQPDEKKSGGAYVTAAGTVKKIDAYKRMIVMTDRTAIPIDEIIAIEGQIFKMLYEG